MRDTDVIIVGKGIAGLVLSMQLTQKGIDHVVLNRQGRNAELALAETLPPSALPLLQKLGLLTLFEQTAIQRTYGYHSVWGRQAVTDSNFFFHRPYQYGLKINKQAIINELSGQQREYIVHYDKDIKIPYYADSISVVAESDAGHVTIRGKLVVDATGRKRAVLTRLRVPPVEHDNIIAFSCHIPLIKHPRLVHNVFIETFSEGWGIVSKLNNAKNAMTLFTHANNPIQAQLKHYEGWKGILADTVYLKDFITNAADIKVKGSKASSSRGQQLSGPSWLAVGDAAISFDPLSSHGITNAIFTAQKAADTIEQHLRQGNKGALKDYENDLTDIFAHYLSTRDHLYKAERRWPHAAFWRNYQRSH